MYLGAFLVKDDRVLKGPLGRSLRLFTCTAHSAHSLCSAPLRSARFTRLPHSWAHSLTSLTPSWNSGNHLKCVHAVNAFQRNKRVFGRQRNTPYLPCDGRCLLAVSRSIRLIKLFAESERSERSKSYSSFNDYDFWFDKRWVRQLVSPSICLSVQFETNFWAVVTFSAQIHAIFLTITGS